jgi:hypothetical protein
MNGARLARHGGGIMRTGHGKWMVGALTWALVACLGAAASASEAPKRKVAVKAFVAKGVEASAASVLEDELCAAFPTATHAILCSSDVRSLISVKQQEMTFGNCTDDEDCARQLAKITESQFVVSGEVSRIGDEFVVSATMLEPAANRVVARARDRAKKIEDLLGKMADIAKKLAEGK